MKKLFLAGFYFFSCCEFLPAQKLTRQQPWEKELQLSNIELPTSNVTISKEDNIIFLDSNLHSDASLNTILITAVTNTNRENLSSPWQGIYSLEMAGNTLSFTADLDYNKESGALNEGFSNIFGTAVQWREKSAQKDLLMRGGFYTLNAMNNPNAYSQPNTYKGIYWYAGTADKGGVHTNCGVMNYWFYLLTSGGSGTNDKAFTYNVSGIGIVKARAIAYRALVSYLTPASVYKDARTWSIKSAEDLYGIGSNEAIQTAGAWDAVGVTATGTQDIITAKNNASTNILKQCKETTGYKSICLP